MEFNLEEWEWPTKGKRRYLVEPFQSDCLKAHGIAWATFCAVLSDEIPSESAVFFRPETSDSTEAPAAPAPNYAIIVDTSGINPELHNFGERPNRAKIEKFLKRPFQPHNFIARTFHFGQGDYDLNGIPLSDHDGAFGLTCFFGEAWAMLYERPNDPIGFRPPDGSWTMPSAQLYQWLRAQFTDSTSELHFAVHWQRKSHQQQFGYFLAHVPQAAAWYEMVLTIARSEAELTSGMRWFVGNDSKKPELYHSNSINHNLPELKNRLHQWGIILRRHFDLTAWYKEEMPVCLHDSYSYHSSHVFVPGQDTSAHERLEAGLFLRDWVQERASPEEIAVLFPS